MKSINEALLGYFSASVTWSHKTMTKQEEKQFKTNKCNQN